MSDRVVCREQKERERAERKQRDWVRENIVPRLKGRPLRIGEVVTFRDGNPWNYCEGNIWIHERDNRLLFTCPSCKEIVRVSEVPKKGLCPRCASEKELYGGVIECPSCGSCGGTVGPGGVRLRPGRRLAITLRSRKWRYLVMTYWWSDADYPENEEWLFGKPGPARRRRWGKLFRSTPLCPRCLYSLWIDSGPPEHTASDFKMYVKVLFNWRVYRGSLCDAEKLRRRKDLQRRANIHYGEHHLWELSCRMVFSEPQDRPTVAEFEEAVSWASGKRSK